MIRLRNCIYAIICGVNICMEYVSRIVQVYKVGNLLNHTLVVRAQIHPCVVMCVCVYELLSANLAHACRAGITPHRVLCVRTTPCNMRRSCAHTAWHKSGRNYYDHLWACAPRIQYKVERVAHTHTPTISSTSRWMCLHGVRAHLRRVFDYIMNNMRNRVR